MTLVLRFKGTAGLEFDLGLQERPDPGGWWFTWNEAETVVTATHALFDAEATYQASVTVRDAWGNAMTVPFQWSFTSAEYRLYLPLLLRFAP